MKLLGLQADMAVLKTLTEEHLPELNNHLKEIGFPLELFAQRWLLTFFASEFPAQISKRVMDWCLLDGTSVLLCVVIAFLRRAQSSVISQAVDLSQVNKTLLAEALKLEKGGKSGMCLKKKRGGPCLLSHAITFCRKSQENE